MRHSVVIERNNVDTKRYGFIFCLLALQMGRQGIAQTLAPPPIYTHINQQAVLSRTGDPSATNELAHQLFKNVGFPLELADSFGFTARIVHTETEYCKGAQPAIREADIVRAVNNLEDTVAAPAWAHTDQQEVRKLRMHLMVAYPELPASREGPDSQGRYKALSDDLGPMEASYVAATLVYQKMWNSAYQFTAAERLQNASLSDEAVHAKSMQRSKVFTDILQGKSQNLSLFDLTRASDHFFTDLAILPLSSETPAEPKISRATATKGGR